MDGQLYATITLKPLRFAFLVPAGDQQSILEAIETCTLLWGGLWNPIIPIYKRTPRWTSRPHQPRPTPEQWLKGHLDFFEPDVVVLANGVTPTRVLFVVLIDHAAFLRKAVHRCLIRRVLCKDRDVLVCACDKVI